MKLLQNELFKLFKTKKLYIFFGIFMVMRIAAVYFYRTGSTVKTVIETANAQSFPIAMKYDAMQFLIIFLAIYVADILTDEYKIGTLKLSLLRPVGRVRLLNSKVAAMAAFNVILTFFSVAATYMVGLAAFGWGDSTVYHGVTYSSTEGVLLTIKVYAATILPLTAFGMICIFIAAIAKNMTTVVTAAFFLFIAGEFLSALKAVSSVAVGLIVNQLFFFSDYFAGNNNSSEMVISFVVNLSYIAVFYLLTLAVLKKRDVLC